MRNLADHPVTAAEVVDTLATIAREYDAEYAYGDMRPLILRIAIKAIQDNPEILEETIKEKMKL